MGNNNEYKTYKENNKSEKNLNFFNIPIILVKIISNKYS